MSGTGREDQPDGERIEDEKRTAMDEVQEELDAASEEEGLGAEAGTAEENGISQG